MGLSVPPAAEMAERISELRNGFKSNPLSIQELAKDIEEFQRQAAQ